MFDPWRLTPDAKLQRVLSRHSTPRKRIYLMAQFERPRKLTNGAVAGTDCFIRNGLIGVNQCTLIKGVNNDPEVPADL